MSSTRLTRREKILLTKFMVETNQILNLFAELLTIKQSRHKLPPKPKVKRVRHPR